MKTVFIIQAHEGESQNMQVLDVCTLELFCKTPEEAIKRAEKLIKKKHYRITKIIEVEK